MCVYLQLSSKQSQKGGCAKGMLQVSWQKQAQNEIQNLWIGDKLKIEPMLL